MKELVPHRCIDRCCVQRGGERTNPLTAVLEFGPLWFAGACELAKALGAGSTGYGSISSITSLNLLDNPINAAGGCVWDTVLWVPSLTA